MRAGRIAVMFKITIREAILLTTIAGLALMLWMERQHNARNDARLDRIDEFFQSIPGSPGFARQPSVPPSLGPITPIAPTGTGPIPAGTRIPVSNYPIGPPVSPQLSDNGNETQ